MLVINVSWLRLAKGDVIVRKHFGVDNLVWLEFFLDVRDIGNTEVRVLANSFLDRLRLRSGEIRFLHL